MALLRSASIKLGGLDYIWRSACGGILKQGQAGYELSEVLFGNAPEEILRKIFFERTNFIDKATGKHIGNKVKVKNKIQYRGSGSHSAIISRSNGSKIVTASKPQISKPLTSQGNSKFPKLTYRDRIIHLLALKPYKKVELVLRLQKDHVNQKDKNQLGSILQQVATMKDNAFTLNKHFYNEVKEDWPMYSEEDKQLIRRKLAQFRSGNELSPPQNSTHSSSPSPPTGSNPASPQKRAAEPDIIDPKYKKPRIAHSAKVPTNNNTISNSGVVNNTLLSIKSDAVSSTRLSPTLDKVSGTQDSRLKEQERRKLKAERKANKDTVKTSPVRDKNSKVSPNRGLTKSSPDVVRESGRTGQENSKRTEGLHNGTSQVASSASTIPHYMTKYSTITSREQRQRYKDDFNAEYDKYRELHNKVDTITKKFIKLQMQLENTPEGSHNYEYIKSQVVDEYEIIKTEHPDFQEEKKHCQSLHAKLARIKELILAYDQSQLMEAS
ncbi:RNA polymerase II elongation factor ELL-like isoform X2 [Ptychodera flava]|uniref:RNA polymerase II elongation factor ELL-like isoform X2 n=1 Tax=Ptychodera flava TaxID=63121 RepID=UPI00396A8F0B